MAEEGLSGTEPSGRKIGRASAEELGRPIKGLNDSSLASDARYWPGCVR